MLYRDESLSSIIKINFDELARWLGPSFMFLFSY
ncbi:hypothetical protein V6Z11_A11G112000 [Gossypium hirsutum]